MKEQNQIEIYQANDGTTQIKVQFEQDTVWLTQRQMAELFGKDVRTISEHIQNIYSTEELLASSTLRKFRIVRQEGKRQVNRNIDHYNLDVIISVGYRVNSKQGTQFRIWANRVLKEYLIKGYAINEKRLAQKEQEVQILKNGIQILGRAIEEKAADNEWLATFTKGLSLLDDYDHEQLDKKGLTTKAAVYPSKDDYQELINEMLDQFDSDVFGRAKDESFESSLA